MLLVAAETIVVLVRAEARPIAPSVTGIGRLRAAGAIADMTAVRAVDAVNRSLRNVLLALYRFCQPKSRN